MRSIRPIVLLTVLAFFCAAPIAGAATYRDIDVVGITVKDEGKISGEFNLVGNPGENDSILIGSPYLSPARVVSDALGFPAGKGVKVEAAVVRFFVRSGDVGEEIEVEVEMFGRELGESEFEGEFTVFGRRLNGRLRGQIARTGKASYTVEIEGPATVDYASLTVRSKGAPASAMPEPHAALLFLTGIGVVGHRVRRRPAG